MHTNIRVYAHQHTRTCTSIYAHLVLLVMVREVTNDNAYIVCLYAFSHVYIRVYSCVYTRIFMCICAYIPRTLSCSSWYVKSRTIMRTDDFWLASCTHIYVYMYICMYICIYVCIYVYMYICMYMCIHVCMYVYMYVCMHVYMYIYVTHTETIMCTGDCALGIMCIYRRIFMCIYIYIYTYTRICT